MHTKQLEYFVEAAQRGSINQTAQKLFISQQALSASISSLEKELGYPLFVRTKQGIILTEQGNTVYKDARQILEIVHSWSTVANAEKEYISGTVHVAAPTAICNSIMPDIILACRKKYPDITIQLYEGRGASLFDHKTIQNDFLIINGYSTSQRQEALEDAKKRNLYLDYLLEDEMLIFINSQHPYASNKKLKLKDLKEFTLAAYPETFTFPYAELYKKFNDQEPYRSAHQENLFNLILKDYSIATVQPGIVSRNNQYISSGSIMSKAISGIKLPFYFYMFYDPEPTSAAKAFLRFLKENIN